MPKITKAVKPTKIKAKIKAKPTVKKNIKKEIKNPKAEYKISVKKTVLGHAPEEYHFVLKDGTRLKNLYDLIDALANMHEDIYNHHVNEQKNDFANWIEDIFEDKNLAKEIKQINNQVETKIALMKKIIKELREMAKA